jgi:hypothetical protein
MELLERVRGEWSGVEGLYASFTHDTYMVAIIVCVV